MRGLPLIAVAFGVLGGCGGDSKEEPAPATQKQRAPETVSAQANIFGAGRAQPPQPSGGGPGVPPPVWQLPEGTGRVVTVPRATGHVNPLAGEVDDNGPGGDGVGPTKIRSYGGISGITHKRNGMFLVGVFLTDDPPGADAPPVLDFTKRESFASLSPLIAQTFFIGDGRNRSYRVPDGATRLFLGFADSYLFKGSPGWYGNNRGQLAVKVDVAGD